MNGLEDFFGNLFSKLNFNPTQSPGTLPTAPTLPGQNIPNYFANLMKPEQIALTNGASGNQSIPPYFANLPQQEQAKLQQSSTNPEALGVNADASNPLKNDMMRKMMLMQFLTRQQSKQQSPEVSSMPPSPGPGPQPGPGMGMS